MASSLRLVALSAALVTLGAVACSSAPAGFDSSELSSGDETTGEINAELSTSVTVGQKLVTTANLNLRTGASTSNSIIRVMPNGSTVVTVNRTTAVNGFYNVSHNGTQGWAYGAYLRPDSGGSNGGGGGSTPSRDAAIARAKAGVGFSYWWGHGRWSSQGPSSSTRGSCSGSCPSCSHSGAMGADCSGFVAKAWQVPSSNSDVSVDSHPYGTVHFDSDTSSWTTVPRSSAIKADAFVYNTNGAGHIFLYESGDPWGSSWTYEARGCSYGIVHNLRTISSTYKAIRRSGY